MPGIERPADRCGVNRQLVLGSTLIQRVSPLDSVPLPGDITEAGAFDIVMGWEGGHHKTSDSSPILRVPLPF